MSVGGAAQAREQLLFAEMRGKARYVATALPSATSYAHSAQKVARGAQSSVTQEPTTFGGLTSAAERPLLE